MPVACPSCGREVAIKDPRPGRFRINCPGCARPFKIEVGPDGTARADPPPVPVIEAVPMPEGADRPAEIGRAARRLIGSIGRGIGLAVRSVVARRSMIGGALILEELGRTTLGTLARGRRVAIGRDVLIRILPADWAGPDPLSLAAATRDEFVARQVVHPNLVRRLDFGEDRGRRYAIEEPIAGSTVAQLMARGDWSNALALSTVLHVARALAAVHRLGIVHGDPGPDLVWIGDDGTVKLDGLGLLGSRAERPVENSVPFGELARRDVQVLGQTLRTLARPRTDHERDAGAVADVAVERLMAIGTPEGFTDLAAAIGEIGRQLAIDVSAVSAIVDEKITEVGHPPDDLMPLVVVRRWLGTAFLTVCLVFALLFARDGRLGLMAGTLFLLAGAVVSRAMIRAMFEGGPSELAGRAREWLLGGRAADRLTVGAVALLAIIVGIALGWWAGGFALALVSFGFAAGFTIAFDAPLARSRLASLVASRDLLTLLRRRGASEVDLRESARRNLGPHWHEPFEFLFGIDATAAALAAEGGRPPRFRRHSGRIAVLRWLDARLQERRDLRDRERFEPIEERAAVARKVNEMTARRRSRRVAEALIVVSREVRATATAPEFTSNLAVPVVPRPIPDLIREAVETPDRLLTSTYSDDRDVDRGPNFALRWLAILIGPRLRFLLGGVLVAAFLLWADQVGVISSSQIKAQAERAMTDRDVNEMAAVDVDLARVQAAEEPLRVPGIPEPLTKMISGYGVGVAGLILLASSVFGGWKIALFAIPGAVVAWLGPRWGVPAIGPLTGPAVASAIGIGLMGIGIATVGRRSS